MIRRRRVALAAAAALLAGLFASAAPTPAGATPPVALTTGHADMGVGIEDGEFEPHIHDDTNDVEYEPDEVVLYALPESQTVVPSNPAYGFLGSPGDPVWILPQVYNPDVLWLGYATEEIDPGVVVGNVVQWRLLDVDGPGDFHLYTTGVFGDPNILFDSPDGFSDDVISVPVPTHAHANWAFGAAGTYTLTVQYDAVLAATSTPISSGPVEYTFVVGSYPPVGECVASGPSVSVGDVSITEGDSGRARVARFPVTLSEPSTSPVEVDWAVVPDTATGPGDLVVRTGTVRFGVTGSGSTGTTKMVSVKLPPDLDLEGDEVYTVELSNPTAGYQLAKAVGAGTIVDDDPAAPQSLAVGDVAVCEGDAGRPTVVSVPITLSEPATSPVTVTYTLNDGSAVAGSDYAGLKTPTKTITFAPGQTTRFVNVRILRDTIAESDEMLTVDVLSATGPATVVDGSGEISILNDDA